MAQDLKLPESAKAFQSINSSKALTLIIVFSVVAVMLLFWLIYFKPPAVVQLAWIKDLSALNATFNGLSTVFLILGFNEIRKKNFDRHMNYMLSAFISSALFLVSYVIYHTFVGDTQFMGEGFVRYIYFFILISHIVLSVFVVPLVLTTFFFALSGKFVKHRKIARWTFPIWLYVSVTGVLVFFFLKIFS
ncbi:MAG: DUF420 domain-containing protein [Balneolaceae bacterium]